MASNFRRFWQSSLSELLIYYISSGRKLYIQGWIKRSTGPAGGCCPSVLNMIINMPKNQLLLTILFFFWIIFIIYIILITYYYILVEHVDGISLMLRLQQRAPTSVREVACAYVHHEFELAVSFFGLVLFKFNFQLSYLNRISGQCFHVAYRM